MKLKMGELSKMSGIAMNTIAYYERAGLLAPSWRTSGRFRLYDDYLLDRLHFIRICRQQGLRHKDIKKLLDFRDGKEEECAFTATELQGQIKKSENELYRLGEHIKELKALKKATQCPNRKNCDLRQGQDLVNICLNCEDWKEE